MGIVSSKNLPQDLRQFVRKKLARKLIVFGILVLLYAAIIFVLEKFVIHTENAVSVGGFIAIGVGVIAAVLRLHFLLADKTFVGTIAKTIVKTTDKTENYMHMTYVAFMSSQQTHTLDLIVSGVDGKMYYKTVNVIKNKEAARANLDRYREGDAVFHLTGTPYTVILPEESDTHVQCAVCGRMNPKTNGTCEQYKHSLIKSFTEFC